MDNFKLATTLEPHFKLDWQSANFPGGAIVTNNPSRIYGIALTGIDQFDLELTK